MENVFKSTMGFGGIAVSLVQWWWHALLRMDHVIRLVSNNKGTPFHVQTVIAFACGVMSTLQPDR